MNRSLLIVLLLLLGCSLLAQEASPATATATGGISSYSYEGARSGLEKLKMSVYILGQVYRPGVYVVPEGTDFLTLLALAGGPKEDAKLTKIRIIRAGEKTVTKDEYGEAKESTKDGKIFTVDLKKYMETGNQGYLYDIEAGDTIIVSGTIFYAFTKVVDFLSKVAIVLSVYNVISNLK